MNDTVLTRVPRFVVCGPIQPHVACHVEVTRAIDASLAGPHPGAELQFQHGAGLHAQDSPLYGAERRGAALTACTRMDARTICERGTGADPDLILLANETLLADPAAGVLLGCEVTHAIARRIASEDAAAGAREVPEWGFYIDA